MTSRLKILPQILVIVNLPVEDDPNTTVLVTEGLVTGLPWSSVGTQYGSSLVANGLVAEVLPFRSTVFNPGMNPTRRGSLGPRLVAPLLVGSYPFPAAEGRGWK